jgi:hypothetical protein
MAASTLNHFIGVFSGAFRGLSVDVPISAVEQLAMLVHNAMDQGRRTYHTSVHVFEVCQGMNPRQTLAALFHDTVYYQVDGGFPHRAKAMLEPLVRVKNGKVVLKTVLPGDTGLAMCAAVFGFRSGDTLPLFGGMNEFLSAVLAVRSLQPYLKEADLLAIAACIETTIPFRFGDASRGDPVMTLAARVRSWSEARGLALGDAQIDRIMVDAVKLGNQDVGGFAEVNPAEFLANTWLLIEESNVQLAAVGVYSIQDYRMALARMDRFLGALDSDSVFCRYGGVPDDREYAWLRTRARRNIEFSRDYLGAKLLGIAVVEALALATGGDCPVSMLLGDIRSPYGRPDRAEDFLPALPATRPLDPELLEVLEKGRSRTTTSDLNASPLSAYVYRTLGAERTRLAMAKAKRMFNGEMSPEDFLRALDGELVRAVARACANIAFSRRNALLAIARGA